MPIAASTDSSARSPMVATRGGQVADRAGRARSWPWRPPGGCGARGATKLANRDRRRRSSSSLPTSREQQHRAPAGNRRALHVDDHVAPGHRDAHDDPASGPMRTGRRPGATRRGAGAGRPRRAARSSDPTRRSVARRSSARRGAARRGCRTFRAARCRTRSTAPGSPPRPRSSRARSRSASARARSSASPLASIRRRSASRRCSAARLAGERLTGDLARHLGSIDEVDERRRAEDEGPEPDQVAPLECLHAAGLDEHEAKDRCRAGDVGGQGRHSAERQARRSRWPARAARRTADGVPIRPGEPRPGQRGEDADDRAEQRVADARRGASPLSRRPRGSDAWRGRAVRAPSRCGATGSPRGAGRAPRDARRGRSRRAATTPGRPVPPR